MNSAPLYIVAFFLGVTIATVAIVNDKITKLNTSVQELKVEMCKSVPETKACKEN